jgi:hypothetical protein
VTKEVEMRLYDRNAAAQYLTERGVDTSPFTVRNWHLAGVLPVRYIGNKAFNTQDELEHVLDQGMPLGRGRPRDGAAA